MHACTRVNDLARQLTHALCAQGQAISHRKPYQSSQASRKIRVISLPPHCPAIVSRPDLETLLHSVPGWRSDRASVPVNVMQLADHERSRRLSLDSWASGLPELSLTDGLSPLPTWRSASSESSSLVVVGDAGARTSPPSWHHSDGSTGSLSPRNRAQPSPPLLLAQHWPKPPQLLRPSASDRSGVCSYHASPSVQRCAEYVSLSPSPDSSPRMLPANGHDSRVLSDSVSWTEIPLDTMDAMGPIACTAIFQPHRPLVSPVDADSRQLHKTAAPMSLQQFLAPDELFRKYSPEKMQRRHFSESDHSSASESSDLQPRVNRVLDIQSRSAPSLRLTAGSVPLRLDSSGGEASPRSEIKVEIVQCRSFPGRSGHQARVVCCASLYRNEALSTLPHDDHVVETPAHNLNEHLSWPQHITETARSVHSAAYQEFRDHFCLDKIRLSDLKKESQIYGHKRKGSKAKNWPMILSLTQDPVDLLLTAHIAETKKLIGIVSLRVQPGAAVDRWFHLLDQHGQAQMDEHGFPSSLRLSIDFPSRDPNSAFGNLSRSHHLSPSGHHELSGFVIGLQAKVRRILVFRWYSAMLARFSRGISNIQVKRIEIKSEVKSNSIRHQYYSELPEHPRDSSAYQTSQMIAKTPPYPIPCGMTTPADARLNSMASTGPRSSKIMNQMNIGSPQVLCTQQSVPEITRHLHASAGAGVGIEKQTVLPILDELDRVGAEIERRRFRACSPTQSVTDSEGSREQNRSVSPLRLGAPFSEKKFIEAEGFAKLARRLYDSGHKEEAQRYCRETWNLLQDLNATKDDRHRCIMMLLQQVDRDSNYLSNSSLHSEHPLSSSGGGENGNGSFPDLVLLSFGNTPPPPAPERFNDEKTASTSASATSPCVTSPNQTSHPQGSGSLAQTAADLMKETQELLQELRASGNIIDARDQFGKETNSERDLGDLHDNDLTLAASPEKLKTAQGTTQAAVEDSSTNDKPPAMSLGQRFEKDREVTCASSQLRGRSAGAAFSEAISPATSDSNELPKPRLSLSLSQSPPVLARVCREEIVLEDRGVASRRKSKLQELEDQVRRQMTTGGGGAGLEWAKTSQGAQPGAKLQSLEGAVSTRETRATPVRTSSRRDDVLSRRMLDQRWIELVSQGFQETSPHPLDAASNRL